MRHVLRIGIVTCCVLLTAVAEVTALESGTGDEGDVKILACLESTPPVTPAPPVAAASSPAAAKPASQAAVQSVAAGSSPLSVGLTDLHPDQGGAEEADAIRRTRPRGLLQQETGVGAMAKWHFARTDQTSMYLGAGGGSLTSVGSEQHAVGMAGIGGSMELSESARLRVEGRFQTGPGFVGGPTSGVSGHVGLIVHF